MITKHVAVNSARLPSSSSCTYRCPVLQLRLPFIASLALHSKPLPILLLLYNHTAHPPQATPPRLLALSPPARNPLGCLCTLPPCPPTLDAQGGFVGGTGASRKQEKTPALMMPPSHGVPRGPRGQWRPLSLSSRQSSWAPLLHLVEKSDNFRNVLRLRLGYRVVRTERVRLRQLQRCPAIPPRAISGSGPGLAASL